MGNTVLKPKAVIVQPCDAPIHSPVDDADGKRGSFGRFKREKMSDDEIATLRELFKQRTADEVKVLRNYVERGEFGAAEIERLVHTLAGTGGILGFPAVAAEAARVDNVFAAGETPSRELLEKLLASMEAPDLEN
jgi:HPt (histidine-containing phosphotransfer) domain-containing protein